ncbi:hypothetical protein Scep_023554 [Stephania cephalantha]|uniref:Uncharacterized protein n=1 Tax=Stephania cephalantha TaxID=152367 RepID=A0AAP0HXI1_9MAGN
MKEEEVNRIVCGGVVFPKLNWSAPKDSAWIGTTGTLQCTSFSEISLLLRSSESLVHDLCHAFDSCVDKSSSRPPKFFLALRKWYSSLLPEMEFRCFVRSKLLVAISQREVTCFYPALLEKKDSLQILIHDFFVDNVQESFESDNYTFDVPFSRAIVLSQHYQHDLLLICILALSYGLTIYYKTHADEDLIDRKKYLEDSCKPKCVKPLLQYQAEVALKTLARDERMDDTVRRRRLRSKSTMVRGKRDKHRGEGAGMREKRWGMRARGIEKKSREGEGDGRTWD